ncbi:LEA type 2 family protein [Wenzhouxiangella sp. XN201]|uniref:NDR1/HIN1-like protein n=1 Tax=Wenzhouxiangella sp. XN201 TaxID=2710755 RepID=UPI0013CBF28F|nr:LEA type 2 family protein [Wenzhouxiangella sp. XN201]NEZ04640.1 LEA type 2 family protein [Wenzhouxiangella sp. XN201]
MRSPLITLAVCLLAACGNIRDVTGEPPLAGIDGLARQGDELVIELALRNVNDMHMQLSAIEFELDLDAQPLAAGREDLPLRISARGREVIRLRVNGHQAGLNRLEALASGERASLPWSLELTLINQEDRFNRASAQGWLHPAPGQPDRFR